MPLPDLETLNLLPVLNAMHEGVIVADADGIVRFYNDTQGSMDDLVPAEVIGRRLVDVYRLDTDTSLIHQCLRTQRPIRNVTFFYQTHLGKQVNILSHVHPLFDNGELVGAINFSKDYQLLEKLMVQPVPEKAEDAGSRPPKQGPGYRFTDIIGVDPVFLNAVHVAKMSSNSPSPIMVCGETGTGKEMFAQAIHNNSLRKNRPFIPVNCAAIPETLLEGILFGTSKGVFTGAIDKSGLFEKANGGSIFLDELDSMPLSLQAKLLRVIQEKKVRKLGSLKETELDIKIISSVSRPPMEIVQKNRLRMDLFYRMGVVTILLPPLRERVSDIDRLCDHFITKLNQAMNRHVEKISPKINRLFNTYAWPGNVRELAHCIEGAMNMVASGRTLLPKHLPTHFFSDSITKNADGTVSGPKSGLSPITLKEKQALNEKTMICNYLTKTSGNAARAARMMGISPQSLNYKLKKHHIRPADYKSLPSVSP